MGKKHQQHHKGHKHHPHDLSADEKLDNKKNLLRFGRLQLTVMGVMLVAAVGFVIFNLN